MPICPRCDIDMLIDNCFYVCTTCGICDFSIIAPRRFNTNNYVHISRYKEAYKKQYHVTTVLKDNDLWLRPDEKEMIIYLFNLFSVEYNKMKDTFGRKNLPHYSFLLNNIFNYYGMKHKLPLTTKNICKQKEYQLIWDLVIKKLNM